MQAKGLLFLWCFFFEKKMKMLIINCLKNKVR